MISYITARETVLQTHKQERCPRPSGEDRDTAEEQDNGVEESADHALEQALYADHEEAPPRVSHQSPNSLLCRMYF